jgi:hypothetical protein
VQKGRDQIALRIEYLEQRERSDLTRVEWMKESWHIQKDKKR